MDSSHFQQASTGGLILNDKNEILFVKRADDDDFLPGFWELPGGGMDYGENPQESLQREIKEECGIDVKILNPLTVNTYSMPITNGEIQRIEITFLCQILDENQPIQLSSEHSAYKWVTKEKIESLHLSDFMNSVIKDALANHKII